MITGPKREIGKYDKCLMYSEALAFEEAADHLGDWRIDGKQPEGVLAVPWMVNKAFAIELYLKILLIEEKEYEAINKEKHNLFGLYKALREETKEKLHRNGIFHEKLLELFSDAFVACRYFYEYTGFIGDGIPTFR